MKPQIDLCKSLYCKEHDNPEDKAPLVMLFHIANIFKPESFHLFKYVCNSVKFTKRPWPKFNIRYLVPSTLCKHRQGPKDRRPKTGIYQFRLKNKIDTLSVQILIRAVEGYSMFTLEDLVIFRNQFCWKVVIPSQAIQPYQLKLRVVLEWICDFFKIISI